MKKLPLLLFLSVAMLNGGCGMALPISPLMFLLENKQSAPHQITPDTLNTSEPTAAPAAGGQDVESSTRHA